MAIVLIKDVTGEVIANITGDIIYYKPIVGQIQQEDYVNLNGFIAYLQNLTKADVTVALLKPMNFGLVNQYNLPIETLEIDY